MKSKKIVIVLLVLLEVIFVHLTFKSLENKPTELYDVKLRDEVNKDNKGFAIMVGDKNGVYTESTSNEWPNNLIYLYNSEKSGCIDNSGEKVAGALSFDSVTNTATITTNKTVNCYMYFDIDTTSPTITKITKTNDKLNSIAISVEANDTSGIVNYYYSIDNGEFVNSTINTYTFENLEAGTDYSIKVYVEDAAGNISETSTETIKSGMTIAQACLNNTMGECLLNASERGMEKTYSVEGDDLYRFVGSEGNTGINNYICLGADTCESGTDNMYRIIGINPTTNELKVIKETVYSTSIQWHNTTGVTWEASDLYNTLNTTWLNSVSFGNIIVNRTWDVGDVSFVSETDNDISTKSSVLLAEKETHTTNQTKVGALSMTDYYLAYSEDQNWNFGTGKYENYINNWIHIINNGSTTDSEWTMSRIDSSYAWAVLSVGHASNRPMNYTYAARPTFYLTPNLQYVSGTGESTNPFVVK